MTKVYNLAIFIFRRDLRLQDNTALIAALKSSQKVLPCFIFDEQQVGKNPYKSQCSIQFMLQALAELQQELANKKGHLFLFHGKCEEIIEKIIQEKKPQAIFFNRDYTPFSNKRDTAIKKICSAY